MKIYTFGLGAIGSNLLLQLIKKYPQFEYTGIDYDVVEERNLNTQAYFLSHIGMSKAQAISIIVGMKLKNFTYKAKNTKIDGPSMVADIVPPGDDVLVIDCFDNKKARNHIQGMDLKNCVHIGFSPEYAAEIIWQERYTTPNDVPEEQDDICEMPDAVPFINFIVSLACLNISDFVDNKVKNDAIVTNKSRIQLLT